MNVRLLRRVQKQILKEPRQFDMDDYFATKRTLGRNVPNCGTAACIAGWAIALSHPTRKPRDVASCYYPAETAGKLLELPGCNDSYNDHLCLNSLFLVDSWPLKFKESYNAAKTFTAKAKIAAKRIDHYIETKGKE